MEQLNEQAYQAMRAGAQVLEADAFGEKVLLLADGCILKLFRRKRLLSSAAWSPYARRFAANARKLAAIGVPVPQVLRVLRIPSIARDAVLYRPLPGKSLRQLAAAGLVAAEQQKLCAALSKLVVLLCEKGMYFRSLHTGNVILTPDGELGLIDFSDMRFYPWSLGCAMRRRATRKMLKNEGEWLDMAVILEGC